MRKVWVLVLVVMVLVVGAVATASRMASERAAALHAEFVRDLERAGTVTVLSDRFDRGWTESGAEIHIEVAGAPGAWLQSQLHRAGLEHARGRIGLRVQVALDHGPSLAWAWLLGGRDGEPVVATAVSNLALDLETARDLGTAVGEIPSASFVTEIRLTGAGQTSVVWEPAQLQSRSTAAPWTAEWRGLDGLIVHSPGGSLKGHVTSRGFEWNGVPGQLVVGGFDLQIDGARDTEGIWNGNVEQRWHDVVWTPAEAAPEAEPDSDADGHWAANEVLLGHRAERRRDELDWTVDLSVTDAVIDGVALEAASLGVKLRHLAANPDPGSIPEPASGPVGGMAVLFSAIEPHLARGLALDPFHIEVSGTDGSFIIEGLLRLDPDHPAATHPLSLLDALEGEIWIDSQGPLMARFGLDEQTVAAWMEAGLARVEAPVAGVQDGGEQWIAAHFALRDGQLGRAPEEGATAPEAALEIADAETETEAEANDDEVEAPMTPPEVDPVPAAPADR